MAASSDLPTLHSAGFDVFGDICLVVGDAAYGFYWYSSPVIGRWEWWCTILWSVLSRGGMAVHDAYMYQTFWVQV